jgi:hypothetical protein
MTLTVNIVLNAWNEALTGKVEKLSKIISDDFIYVNQSSNEIMKKDACIEWTIKSGAGQKMFEYKSLFENTECLVGTHIISTIDNINYKVMFFAKLKKEIMTEYHVLARFEDYE